MAPCLKPFTGINQLILITALCYV